MEKKKLSLTENITAKVEVQAEKSNNNAIIH